MSPKRSSIGIMASGEGVAASGDWNLDWLWGNFDMQREKFRVEELEDEIEVTGPVPF